MKTCIPVFALFLSFQILPLTATVTPEHVLVLKTNILDFIHYEMKDMLANITTIDLEALSDFFRRQILIFEDQSSSNYASALDKSDEEEDRLKLNIPFLKFQAKKKYTLVLDLDETLIHFRVDKYNENKGLLRIRPGLSDFLKELFIYYELVIFTASTQNVRNITNVLIYY